jgi:hypothetical protein
MGEVGDSRAFIARPLAQVGGQQGVGGLIRRQMGRDVKDQGEAPEVGNTEQDETAL